MSVPRPAEAATERSARRLRSSWLSAQNSPVQPPPRSRWRRRRSGARYCRRTSARRCGPSSSNGVVTAGIGPDQLTLFLSIVALILEVLLEARLRGANGCGGAAASALSRAPVAPSKRWKLALRKPRRTGSPGLRRTSLPQRAVSTAGPMSKSTMHSWPVGSTTLTLASTGPEPISTSSGRTPMVTARFEIAASAATWPAGRGARPGRGGRPAGRRAVSGRPASASSTACR